MSDNDEREVTVRCTITREYVLQDTIAVVAKVLGISGRRIVRIIDDGDDLPELSDAAFGRLERRADMEDEEQTLDDIEEC